MTIPVELAALGARVEEYGAQAYLLTAGPDGRPHSVGLPVKWSDGLLLAEPGNRSLANAAAHPLVALLWPPPTEGGYTLIVDADVVSTRGSGAGDNEVTLRPTKAVLHRPAGEAPAGATGCVADCVPVYKQVS